VLPGLVTRRDVEAPSAVPNEGQSVNVFAAVHPVVTFCARRFWQQSFAFVIPDRLNLGVSRLGQFTDFHIFTLSGGKKVAPFYL
jgi:hypothetical protein